MEIQEVKEQLKEIFRTVINNDKWITIHPNGEDGKGRHLLLKDGESPKEAIDRVYKKEDKKGDKNKYLKKGDLETDKVYKLGNLYVKPFVDDDGDLAFYDRTGAWGEGSVAQKFLKSDLKNLERAEKYDKLTDKELKFLSEKGDFEKGTKSTKKDEDRHQKVRDLEDKAYKEFKTMYDNYIDKDGMEGWGGIPASRFDKAKEQFNKKYKDAFDKLESDRFVSFEDFAKRENKQSDTKDGSKDISKEEYAKIKEQVSKMSDDELVKAHFESQKGYESDTPRAGSMTKHEATYGEVAQELKRRTGRGFSAASTESEIKEALLKAKSDSKGDLDIKKTTVKMKSGKTKEIEYVDSVPEGYKKLEGAMTAPLGYTWYHNGKSIIDKERKTILVKDKVNNNKEQDMALIEELKKLITKVENTKGEKDMEIENEKVDKRDIIRQIMAIAGKEEASEDVKTIAKLAEKLAYDKSEAGTADNKCKNEDDEKEVKEVKEDVKEDVENKCKNSVDNSKVDYFSKLNEIYNAASKVKDEVEYVSQADREKAAEDYFAK